MHPEMQEREQPSPSPSLPKRLSGSTPRRRSNLALGLLLIPGARRRDAFLLHDFCRTVDDIADGNATPVEKQAQLDAWLTALTPEGESMLPGDFAEMIRRRGLDRHLLAEIVRGMRMDTEHDERERNRYATFGELLPYCRRVASAVGVLSARLFGAEGAAAERYAEELGVALQLTNILRDVPEDAARNRIYLPLEDLERFGVSEREILDGTPSPEMTHLLNHQAERADAWFAKAERSWVALPAAQRRLLRPARLMSALYRDLLLRMHRDRYDVFARRYRVPVAKKLLLLLRVVTSGD